LTEDRRPAIETADVELTDLPDAAPDAFAPPDGAEALPWCEGLRTPERTRKVDPVYPESARMRRAGGRVTLDGRILEDGAVGHLAVVRPLCPDLDAAAVEAVRQWRYRSARCGETPVQVGFVVEVSFSIR
jgi:protein TonB